MIRAKMLSQIIFLCIGTLGLALIPSVVSGDPDFPDWVSLENPYIGVSIGQAHHLHLSPRPVHTYYNDQPVAGRFAVWNILGDPEVPDDDSKQLTFTYRIVDTPSSIIPADRWSCILIWVDGTEYVYGSSTGSDGAGWTVVPHIPTNQRCITSTYYPNTGEAEIPVRIDQVVTLVHDMVKFQWDIVNEDSMPHMVGVRLINDYLTNPWDGGTEELANVPVIPGKGIVEYDYLASGLDVPDALEAFNSQTEPVMSIRAIFRGNGATTPDKIGSDDWYNISGDFWTYFISGIGQVEWLYETIPYHRNHDVTYGAWWKPIVIRPGQKRRIIHYFGNACASHDFTRPNLNAVQYVSTVQGPRCLRYYQDDTGASVVLPDPFKVTAYMGSIDQSVDLHDVSCTLILPPGLELDDSENGRYTKSTGFAAAFTESKVEWVVKPVGYPTGILDYSVSFSASPVGGTTVTRSVNIPATDKQPMRKYWQMISVPFDLVNPAPEAALGLTGTASMWEYDTYARRYREVTSLTPGRGYWLWLDGPQNTNMVAGQFSPRSWTGTQGTYIPLQPGWNMIGNPYVYAITLGELRVYTQQYGTLTIDEAAAKGLIYKTLFWYDPVFRQYIRSTKSSDQLKPWQGYWIKALRTGVSLVMTPVSQIGASVGGNPPSDGGGGGGGPLPPGI